MNDGSGLAVTRRAEDEQSFTLAATRIHVGSRVGPQAATAVAGNVNVLRNAKSSFPNEPLYGTMGGFHLSGNTETINPQTHDF